MAYDPNYPVDHQEIIAVDFRNQFHGIKDLIDAGVPGPQGIQGVPGIDGTNGTNGTNGIDGATGAQGIQGPPGNDGPQGPAGADGAAGADGPQGIPGTGLMNFQGFWQPANPYDAGAVVLHNGVLYITAFATTSGPPDTDPATWSAISFPLDGTAKNPSAVLPLGMTGTPTYDPSQFQTVIDRFDELLAALKR